MTNKPKSSAPQLCNLLKFELITTRHQQHVHVKAVLMGLRCVQVFWYSVDSNYDFTKVIE